MGSWVNGDRVGPKGRDRYRCLFPRSKSVQKSNSELMVLCTVKRISPSNESPAGPKLAKPYLDSEKFDKNK